MNRMLALMGKNDLEYKSRLGEFHPRPSEVFFRGGYGQKIFVGNSLPHLFKVDEEVKYLRNNIGFKKKSC